MWTPAGDGERARAILSRERGAWDSLRIVTTIIIYHVLLVGALPPRLVALASAWFWNVAQREPPSPATRSTAKCARIDGTRLPLQNRTAAKIAPRTNVLIIPR